MEQNEGTVGEHGAIKAASNPLRRDAWQYAASFSLDANTKKSPPTRRLAGDRAVTLTDQPRPS
jgi:hypothetical protein